MNRLRDLLVLLPVAGYYLALSLLNRSVAPDILPFVGFVALFIVFPAICYGSLVLREETSLLERLFLGSPVAISALVCLMYAEAAARVPWLVWLAPALGVGALALAAALPGRRGSGPGGAGRALAPCATSWPDVLLLAAALAVALGLALLKVVWSTPDPGGPINHYADDYWMGAYIFSIARAVELGLPVMHFGLADFPVGYHFFYHYTYAACLQLTGIHPMDMVLFLAPAVFLFLLIGATVVGCRRLARFTPLETTLALVLIVFGAGYGFSASHTIQVFYFFHTYGFGLPYYILFAAMMYGYLAGRTEALGPLFGSICFFAMCGGKADLAIVIPLGLFPVLLLRLFTRRLRLADVLLAVGCLAALVALKLMLYMGDTSRASMEQLPKLMKVLTGAAGGLKEMFVVVGVYVALMLFAADGNPAIRAKLARARQFLIFTGVTMLAVCVALKLYNFVGGDQYFFWHAKILVLLAFAPVAAHILAWRNRGYYVAVLAIFVFALGFSVHSLNLASYMIAGKPRATDAPMPIKYDGALSPDELRGLDWAFRNIPHSKSFFTNRDHYFGNYLGADLMREFSGYVAMSGLQGYCWIAGDMLGKVRQMALGRIEAKKTFLASGDAESAALALGAIKADYYFHCTRMAPVVAPPGLVEVYRNPGLVIYENTYGKKQPAEIQGAQNG